jgi:beta-lactam-binding protein with PASTA domain
VPASRPNATRILLTALATGALSALSACGGFSPATSTSPATSQTTSPAAPTPTGTAGPSGSTSATSTETSPYGNRDTAIPQLAGDTVSVAELYLQQAGLRAGQTLQRSNTEYQSGLVITTSPYAGKMVPSRSAVDLLVSDGSPGCQGPSSCNYFLEYITMPYVTGQTVPEVTTTLALDGITLGTSAVEASSEPAGTVICTDPKHGASFPNTEKVNVGVSSGDPGSPPATVCVPPAGPPASSTGPPPTSPTGPPPTSPASPPPTSSASPPSASPVQPSVSP